MAAVGTDADTDAHIVVHRQLQDIVLVQQQQIEYFSEMIKNKEEESVSIKIYEDVVKELEESEKLQFALGEVEILMKQLEREKKAFENALESIKNKAWKEVNKNDKLKSKCNDIENKVEKQEDILSSKEDQIKELCHQLAKQKATLKQQVTEFEIQKQQNAYIERVLEGKKKKACGKFIPTSK
ncbi:spermatogenesis-associated protein 24-like isoform X2 [Leucoraja erinacea]|uniref:spermatogenesis-associated protein 24-like isoform X2 n=1 Tax=Leucoraja erinaceus TaxID=7782 RepID=UPI002455601B|nr:spermatogenesis-associated protein 24-like isoform X2 [Leucoraja erinacea]